MNSSNQRDYLDLGSIQIPVRADLDVSVDYEPETQNIVSITLSTQDSLGSIQLFAAAKDSDDWAKTRYEIAARLESTKVQPKVVTGTFGAEIHAVMPVYDKQGSATVQAVRFLGIMGDRWFMRVTVTGAAALEPSAIAGFDSLLAELIVNRGEQPIVPGDRLPIQFVYPETNSRKSDYEKQDFPAFHIEI